MYCEALITEMISTSFTPLADKLPLLQDIKPFYGET